MLLPTRRTFLQSALGSAALASLGQADEQPRTHFPPTAKRVIYLFQSGAPSQLDLFDHKPKLKDYFGKELPDSIRKGQRLTGMTATQESFPIAPSKYRFAPAGKCGTMLSELLPETAKVADELCLIKTLHTEAINHDPAITFFQTGAQLAGRPSFGSWVTYGLANGRKELPDFVVLVSQGSGNPTDQPLYDRLWGSGFLPTSYQGVKFRSQGDPVLYLSDPGQGSPEIRQRLLTDLQKLNDIRRHELMDSDVSGRTTLYEMAFRMQESVPKLLDLSKESKATLDRYGEQAKTPGTFAANCLMARRLAERGVQFIQLYHRGWDQHTNLPKQIEAQCRDVDRAGAALIADLKERDMLKDTLVVWAGEFGRTVYCQGRLTATDYGRDHHPRCFSAWMAGGGIRGGQTYGQTDDFSYNVVENGVHVHDLNATILHCLGIDHTKLTYKYQGRQFRLTDVHGTVVKKLLA